ncbi:MAG: hypothetical protein RLZZ623_3849 [Actinomycetota bacterium]
MADENNEVPEPASTPASSPTPKPAPKSRPKRRSRWDRPKEPHDWRWIVGGLGRILISIGVLLFAFVGYQLWGTGIQTAQAQNRLANEFDQQLAAIASTSSTTSTTTSPATPPGSTPDTTAPESTTTTQPLPMLGRPTLGDPVARLDIPSIGMKGKIVIEGVRPSDLADGPGHFPETPLPGQFGNAAIAGHRTTHGQPFFRIDEIAVGDQIIVTTLAGRYVYIVTGSTIVSPNDYSQVIPTVDPSIATLTLTSCHPRFSSKQRIVIFSEIDPSQSSLVTAGFGPLDDGTNGAGAAPDTTPSQSSQPAATTAAPGTSAPATETTTPGTIPGSDAEPDSIPSADAGSADAGSADAGSGATTDSEELFANRWFSDSDAFVPVALWGFLLSAISIGAYLISKRARRNWVGLLVGIVPFIVVLYFFFENVNRLLPPNL